MNENRSLAALWLDALSAERGASPNTLSSHNDALKCYLDSLDGNGIELITVTTDHIRDYLGFLDGRSYAEASIHYRRSVARSLQCFLVAEDYAIRDPTFILAPAKRRKTQDEMDEIRERARRVQVT